MRTILSSRRAGQLLPPSCPSLQPRLAPSLCALFLLVISPTANAETIRGVVTGGGAASGLDVVALRSPNLREADLFRGLAPVDRETGRFELTTLTGAGNAPQPSPPVWIVVTAGCPPSQLRAGRFDGCRTLFPHRGPVTPGTALRLQIPDLTAAEAIWRGETRPTGPWRPISLTILAVFAILGIWLIRHPRADMAAPTNLPLRRAEAPWLSARWLLPALALGATSLLGIRLGSEPLDLLEYSYFHEGVRPETTGAVLTDFISSELAHGPVMPLILRGAERLSRSPWVLRLPSLLFGLLFVLVTFDLTRRHLGRTTALWTALLATAAPVAAMYARDATPYALCGLCAALTLWLMTHPTSRPAHWAALTMTQVVGFFAHYGYAFFCLAVAVGATGAWVRGHRRRLGATMLAFTTAGILPALAAPHLVTMIEASGIRFALMSPVYVESPGLLAFVGTFLTALSGLPARWTLGLLITLPLWTLGAHALSRRAPVLAWLVLPQAALIGLWLLFSHTMSTEVGGGRVFYAFRWTRPMLLGVLLPLGALSLRWRWALAPILGLWLWQTTLLVTSPSRPAQDAASDLIAQGAIDGDAYAVRPAAFYGDPLQYHLAGGQPPGLVTQMRQRPITVGRATIHGPILDHLLPLETEMDRLAFERVWLVTYEEHMLGVPKFAPSPPPATPWRLTGTWRLPHLRVDRYDCPGTCEWRGDGKRTLRIDPTDRLRSERYREGEAWVLPEEARTLRLIPRRAGATAVPPRISGPRVIQQTGLVASIQVAPARARVTIAPFEPGDWFVELVR